MEDDKRSIRYFFLFLPLSFDPEAGFKFLSVPLLLIPTQRGSQLATDTCETGRPRATEEGLWRLRRQEQRATEETVGQGITSGRRWTGLCVMFGRRSRRAFERPPAMPRKRGT